MYIHSEPKSVIIANVENDNDDDTATSIASVAYKFLKVADAMHVYPKKRHRTA